MTILFGIVCVCIAGLIVNGFVCGWRQLLVGITKAWFADTDGVLSVVKKYGYLLWLVSLIVARLVFVVFIIVGIVSHVIAWFK